MPTSKQRRAAERRRLRRQAQRHQQQLARRRRLNVILSVVGTLLIIGVVVTLIAVTSGGSDSEPEAGASTSRTTSATPSTPASSASAKTSTRTSTSASAASTTPSTTASSATTTSAAPAATTSCSYPRSGTAARVVRTPPTRAAATGTASVRLATSRGAMTFTLDRATSPCAVNSFVSLARQKFYDNTSCHRLVNKSIFVLQCGDPTGTGSGGPGYRFADELGTEPVFRRGTLVMANGGPNSNGSQFFIIDRDTRLGADYTPLGKVSSGLSVADAVYRAGTSDGSSDGPPKLRLTFRTLTVT